MTDPPGGSRSSARRWPVIGRPPQVCAMAQLALGNDDWQTPAASRSIQPPCNRRSQANHRSRLLHFAGSVDGRRKVCEASKRSSKQWVRREKRGRQMTSIGTKLKVGTAACGIAVAASLTSIAPAEAAPAMPAPAAPVLRDLPQGWWHHSDEPESGGWFQKILFHFCGGYNHFRI